MSNPWFRLYNEFDSDPKVQSMPEVLQRRLIMLFCSKCRGETLQETERAFHWRIGMDELAATKAVFIEKGFIEGDWELVNWNRRQFLSDSSTDRVRKHRQAMKQDETLHETNETKRNVTVTPPDTEQIQKQSQKKPSRGKREEPPIHTVFKGLIFDAWKEWGNPLDTPWDGAEGKQLGMLIGANPKLGPDGLRRLLQYRARSSGVNLAERPSKWLRGLTDYARGPLNQFKQPEGTNGRPNKSDLIAQTANDARGILRAGRMAVAEGFDNRADYAGASVGLGSQGKNDRIVEADIEFTRPGAV